MNAATIIIQEAEYVAVVNGLRMQLMLGIRKNQVLEQELKAKAEECQSLRVIENDLHSEISKLESELRKKRMAKK